jgi:hypothetical protein
MDPKELRSKENWHKKFGKTRWSREQAKTSLPGVDAAQLLNGELRIKGNFDELLETGFDMMKYKTDLYKILK